MLYVGMSSVFLDFSSSPKQTCWYMFSEGDMYQQQKIFAGGTFMKKVVALCLVAMLLIPGMAFAKTQVRWFVGLGTGANEQQIAPQEKVVEDFNKSQDEIELVLEIVANAQAFDVLATQVAAGNAPDIIGPVGLRGRDSFKGNWLDMQPLVDKFKYDLSDFDSALVDFYKAEEGQLGLPFGIYPSFMFVNKDLFDEAGLPYPPQKYGEQYDGKEWNMETVAEIAKILTVDSNGNDATSADFDSENIEQFGFGIQWTDMRGAATFFGADKLYTADGKAQMPDAWREAIKWLQKAMWEDYFHPNGANGNSDYMGQGNWFQTGHIAMDLIHMWYAGCCMGEFEGTWDTAVIPSYKGTTTAKMHADTFLIHKDSKNPEAAFQVLSYLLGPAANSLLDVYGAMPARLSMQEDYFKKFSEANFPGQDINWQVVVDSMSYADNPNHESWMPSFQEANNAYNEFWTKIQNEKDADVDAEIEALLSNLQKIFDAAK
jgi:multiple sugar transport system substrate-binding protein